MYVIMYVHHSYFSGQPRSEAVLQLGGYSLWLRLFPELASEDQSPGARQLGAGIWAKALAEFHPGRLGVTKFLRGGNNQGFQLSSSLHCETLIENA